MEDSQLIDRFCRLGERDAAQELLRRYERSLTNYLWQMLRHPQDCEDAVQETFGKVLRALPAYREENRFEQWLFRIGRNQALNMIQHRKRVVMDPEPENLGPQFESPLPDAAASLEAKERIQALERAIAKLPEAEREVIILRSQADLPFKQIAELTGAPLGTVLARAHKARQKLKSLLDPSLSKK
ncbi:MAG: sigma-70 family RNA polymerase sigma factor [Verrucomicrobiota bacterium]